MNKAYVTDTLRSVKRTFSRFVSIIAIVALGCSIFCGFKAVYPDMLETADNYYKQYNLMDLRLQSYIGLYDADLDVIREMKDVSAVQGVKFVDGYVQTPSEEEEGEFEGVVDIDGSEFTIRVMGLDLYKAVDFQNGGNDPEYITRLKPVSGRYPEADNECVVTCSDLATPEEFIIDNTIRIVGDNEEITYYLKNTDFKIVGIVQTPYWLSYERGATTAGSGKLGDFIYVKDTAFTDKINYYSEAYVTLKDSGNYTAYSDEYNNYVDGVRKQILDVADGIAAARRKTLSVGLEEKLKANKPLIENAEATVQKELDEGYAKLQELYEMEKTGAEQIDKAQKELEEKYNAAQAELDTGSDEYIAAVNEYNEKYTAVSNSQLEQANRKIEYNKRRTEADLAKEQLDEANTKLVIANAEISATTVLIESTESTLLSLKQNQDVAQGDLDLDKMAERLEQTNPELAQTLRAASNLTAQGMAADAIVEVDDLLEQYKAELAAAIEQRDAGQIEYNLKKSQWDEADAQLRSAKEQLDAADNQLAQAEKALAEFKDKIDASGDKLQFGALQAQTEYTLAQAQIAQKMTQLQNIKGIIADAEKKYAKAEREAGAGIGVARTEYNKGVALLENINDEVGWLVYDRDDSPGYTGYGEATANMERFSYIFPTFFFIVSTLVCLTTMTRMVEEERTQLGTLKALGYTNRMISAKYLFYAGIASSIGAVIGIALGFWALPTAIAAAWNIMYEMPPTVIHYMPVYIVTGLLLSVGLTLLATFIACRKDLKSVPAVLMRPKPPKDGKRVLLENVGFIWSNLSFTSKVTVRNLFRNKKRFVVTVLGIAGCTAMLLSGFGFSGSIGAVIDNQYGDVDGVAKYDLQVVLKDAQVSYKNSSMVSSINSIDGIEQSMLGYLKVCTGSSDRSEKEMEVDVLVPEDPNVIRDFININSGRQAVPFTDEGAVITAKFAKKTKTQVGDTIKLTWTEGAKEVTYEVPVTGIADNYTFHYVYLTPYCYKQMTGSAPTYNYLFCEISDDIDRDGRVALEQTVNGVAGVNGTVFTSVIIDNFNNIINTLNLIIYIFVACAMLLAVVVLYTLNNININERVKELATLKVLGFYNGEVSAYIYRENVILTLFGILFGVGLGVPLFLSIINAIDIDTLTFSTVIDWKFYLISGGITLLFAVVVNIIMHFNLKKISMVESLKSVE